MFSLTTIEAYVNYKIKNDLNKPTMFTRT